VGGAGGGSNVVGGIGPMLVYAINMDGEPVCIVDDNAVWIEASPQQPRFRVLGQMRLKEKGLSLQQCYRGNLDVWKCTRAGEVIPLTEQEGILVLETPKMASDLNCEAALRKAAVDIGKGVTPPVLPLNVLLQYDVSGSDNGKRTKGNLLACAVTALLFATTICTLAVSSMVLNEGKLSSEERAWLWHWRWGHGGLEWSRHSIEGSRPW
jgi:hypothetical protein